MKYSLGISAILTDRYLSMNLEFGNDEAITPHLVKSATITLKSKDGLELRTLTTISEFSNSDGCFKLGTILFDEENPHEVFALVDTTKGKFQANCVISIAPNTITSEQF